MSSSLPTASVRTSHANHSEGGDNGALPPLQTPTELSTAHAQLVLLEEAIRAAASAAVAHNSGGQSQLRASETRRSVTAPAVGSPTAAMAAGDAGAHGGGIMATPRTVNVSATPSGASERLSALHDNLRRVRRLMQEYEEASQHVIQVHLIPSTETGEAVLGTVTVPRTRSARSPSTQARTSTTTTTTTITTAAAAAAAGPFSEPVNTGDSNGNSNGGGGGSSGRCNSPPAMSAPAASPQQTSTPSLHQRRALASDAVFTRFCGLRVTPDQLLLPLPDAAASQAATPSPSAVPAQRAAPGNPTVLHGIADDGEDEEDMDDWDSADTTTPGGSGGGGGSSQGNRSGQTPAAGATVVKQNSGMQGTTPSFSLRMAQQRQRANAEAALRAYSQYFFHPLSTTAASSPPVTPRTAGLGALSPLTMALGGATAVGGGATTTPAVGTATSARGTPTPSGATPWNTPPPPTVTGAGSGVLRELHDTQQQFDALQRCRLFAYEARLRAVAADGDGGGDGGESRNADAPADDLKWQHMPVAVQRMRDSLAALQTRFTHESHYASCGEQPVLLARQLHAWTQPLLRQLNELLSNPTLEEVDENTREKLRRMQFDVEELQQAQAQAIAGGDMQHSEELYYEQTGLAETMSAPYDELEATMQEYGEVCIDAPLAGLEEQRELLTSRLTRVIEEHTGQLSEVSLDAERVKEKRRAVATARHRQRNTMSSYHHAWKKTWQTNSDQQMACYRAMEHLEKQLHDLQQAQSFLVDDWISRVTQERQREEDAAAFACFADARAAALAETQSNLQAVIDGVRQYSGAVQFACRHAEAFAREVLQGRLSATQLALRKDRLEHFRTLYLTLGDLRFKKARNAEEMEKKVEYYTLQQEVAMDALNPKAKEFSQAKQRWEAAKAEALAQLSQLDRRSQLQLEAFRPTEQRLREAGVQFVSPEEELARRTQQRSQKLIEYQQLIEEGIGVRPPSAHSAPPAITAAPAAPTRLSTSKALLGGTTAAVVRGHQLPPLPNADRAQALQPRPHVEESDMDSLSATERTSVSAATLRGTTLRSLAATAATAATASQVSLHSTEERIMQDVSKTALVGRGRVGSANASSDRRKHQKR
ncbi:paraflagellar rod protein [Novymonas esmeraldas]|uniref:Paraflagellar rod protein n=1 Tax=Novymonas esmeraldas TaxID=1808958 RepID=A0AAW0EZW2_9TRYP